MIIQLYYENEKPSGNLMESERKKEAKQRTECFKVTRCELHNSLFK